MSAVSAPARAYETLRREVETAWREGRVAAEAAAIGTSWRVGRLLHEHVLRHADRADYGARTLRRLAADLAISERVLYRCWLLGRSYEISPPAAKLTCAHYFALSRLEPGPQRDALAAEAERRGWIAKELEHRVSAALASAANDTAAGAAATAASPRVRLLSPKLGTPGVYRLVARDSGLALDLGFKLYRPLAPAAARSRTAGQFVRAHDDAPPVPAAGATAADLFTYAAVIRRTIDGDTLAVTVKLAGSEMDEKLRLRGLDCPELTTAAGRAAKTFVETLVRAAAAVTVTTSKVDKYDRYLADVHLHPGPEGFPLAGADAAAPLFLNNALLREGHAERAEGAGAEWLP